MRKKRNAIEKYRWLLEFSKKYDLEPTIDTAMWIEDAVASFRKLAGGAQ